MGDVLFELIAAIRQFVTPRLDLGEMNVEFAMLLAELALLLLTLRFPGDPLCFKLALHFLNCLGGFRQYAGFQGGLCLPSPRPARRCRSTEDSDAEKDSRESAN